LIRRATPLRYDRPAESGRTKPLRIAVETDDGVEHDVVLKPSSGPECSVESLISEMLGSLLAADLDLPVNEPYLVELTPEFVASVAPAPVRQRLDQSCPVAFASEHAGTQWRRWLPSDKIVSNQVGTALGIVAFDAFVGNSDRSPRNPNLLVRDLAWRMIDHESAFRFKMMLFARCEPWVVGNLELLRRNGQDSEHIFAKQLAKSRDQLNFGPVRDLWSGLSDARLAQYDATLPAEWEDTRPHLAEALDHLKKVRDNIDLCLNELKRVLS
jgi:hypothetical protein